jgi:hypothetical protein
VRYQGTYTASVPGAITRKIAEPMIAAARCTIGAYTTPRAIYTHVLKVAAGGTASPLDALAD